MPGYRPIPDSWSGAAAAFVRAAEALSEQGENEAAVRLLESALGNHSESSSEIPGWLVGRMADLYRRLRRYDDEVSILERFVSSNTAQEGPGRLSARLSKARTLAERHSRASFGALDSVRESLERPSRARHRRERRDDGASD